ncbi:MAG: hypothetical protein R3E52_14475 [Burkholderiaceae bacterium]
MGVGNAALYGGLVEVQAGKVARVGGVAQAQVDAVGAMVDGGLERRQAAGGADQFGAVRVADEGGLADAVTMVCVEEESPTTLGSLQRP